MSSILRFGSARRFVLSSILVSFAMERECVKAKERRLVSIKSLLFLRLVYFLPSSFLKTKQKKDFFSRLPPIKKKKKKFENPKHTSF